MSSASSLPAPSRFVFHNRGAAVHDAFIGDEAARDDHEIQMRAG